MTSVVLFQTFVPHQSCNRCSFHSSFLKLFFSLLERPINFFNHCSKTRKSFFGVAMSRFAFLSKIRPVTLVVATPKAEAPGRYEVLPLCAPALLRGQCQVILKLEVPVNCLGDTGLKSLCRLPIKLAGRLARINRIAPIMPRPVLDETN